MKQEAHISPPSLRNQAQKTRAGRGHHTPSQQQFHKKHDQDTHINIFIYIHSILFMYVSFFSPPTNVIIDQVESSRVESSRVESTPPSLPPPPPRPFPRPPSPSLTGVIGLRQGIQTLKKSVEWYFLYSIHTFCIQISIHNIRDCLKRNFISVAQLGRRRGHVSNLGLIVNLLHKLSFSCIYYYILSTILHDFFFFPLSLPRCSSLEERHLL